MFDDFILDPGERRLLRVKLEPVALTGKPFDLLVLLVENADRLMTRMELMDKIWGDTQVEEQNLHVAISTIRKGTRSQRLV